MGHTRFAFTPHTILNVVFSNPVVLLSPIRVHFRVGWFSSSLSLRLCCPVSCRADNKSFLDLNERPTFIFRAPCQPVIFSTYAISISLEKNSSISDATDEGGFFVVRIFPLFHFFLSQLGDKRRVSLKASPLFSRLLYFQQASAI